MGLGRGLGSLIPKKIASEVISEDNKSILFGHASDNVMQIPVDAISVNPLQPRQVFDHEGLEELIESIKIHGIIQPLIVSRTSEGYELIAGERRLRAAKTIGLSSVPALVREVKEQEKLELALIENVQRRNLNPIEKGVAYQRLGNEFNLTQEEVAKKMGVSRAAIANTIRLLDLPEEVQKAVAENAITEGHAKVIAGLETESEQLDFLKKILQYNFTVRDAEAEKRRFEKKTVSHHRQFKDPILEEKEDRLRGKLNTKVSIKKKGERGQIIIDFYSDEELDAIVRGIAGE